MLMPTAQTRQWAGRSLCNLFKMIYWEYIMRFRKILAVGVSSAVLFAAVVSTVHLVSAAARFSPGETLNPGCSPTDPDCTVTFLRAEQLYVVPDITARDALTNLQIGDHAIVTSVNRTYTWTQDGIWQEFSVLGPSSFFMVPDLDTLHSLTGVQIGDHAVVTNINKSYVQTSGGVWQELLTPLNNTYLVADLDALNALTDIQVGDHAEVTSVSKSYVRTQENTWQEFLVPENVVLDKTYVVADEAARDALSGLGTGDVAVVTGMNKTFIYDQDGAWQELLSPEDQVQSVNGKIGEVVLSADDILEGITNRYFTNANARGAFSVLGPLSYDSSTGIFGFIENAILSLLPSVSGHAGKFLTTDGTGISWATVSSGGEGNSGTVVSVTAGDGLSGGIITESGTIGIDAPTCTGTDKLTWNGSVFSCATDEVGGTPADETDPVFGISPSAGITGTKISNWDTAFGWGNHTGLYRLISYVPTWEEITGKPTMPDGTFESLTGKPTTLAGYGITDSFSGSYTDLTNKPILFSGVYADLSGLPTLFSGDYAALSNKPVLFDGAYASLTGLPVLFSGSYNDLTDTPALFNGTFASLTGTPTTLAGYGITDSFSGNYADLINTPSETDPVFTASSAFGIAGSDITNWNTAFNWGSHAVAGYLRSYTETDPTIASQTGNSGKFLTTDGTVTSWTAVTAVAHNLLSATHSDTLAGTVVRGDIMVGNLTPKWSRLALGSVGKILRSDGTDLVYSTATYPATVTVNRLLYASATNVISDLATANSGILVTSIGGVPSIATDIPTAVTIGGAYVYRVGGTDVSVADGGTGTPPGADDQIFVSSSTTAGAWKSLADCTDTEGNHLNYTASTNSFSCGTSGASSAHNFLSATHTDTLAATVTRGDIIVGNGTPKWSDLALGSAGKILRSDGTDLTYSTATYPNTATTGDLIYASSANTFGNLAAVASGYYLASAGTSTAPVWTALPTITTVVTRPSTATGAVSTYAPNVNLTERGVVLFNVPQAITVNQLSFYATAVGGSASPSVTAKVCIYNEAGTSKLIDVTTASITSLNVPAVFSTTVSPAVSLPPGNYYLAFGLASKSGTSPTLTVRSFASTIFEPIVGSVPSGKKAYEGLVTHASGVCDSTLGAFTAGSTNKGVTVRLDN